MNLKPSKRFSEDRLLSLDSFRGVTMFLLVAAGTYLWLVLVEPPVNGTIFRSIFLQFHHHPWNGFVAILTAGFLNWFKTPEFLVNLITTLSVLSLKWLLCYYLFVKRIFLEYNTYLISTKFIK